MTPDANEEAFNGAVGIYEKVGLRDNQSPYLITD